MFKTGQVFFTKDKKNIISKIMAWFMQSEWSHSGLIYQPTERHTYTLETNDYCVTHNIVDSYMDEEERSLVIYEVLNQEGTKELEAMLKTRETVYGKTYGYFQLISLGLRRLLMRVGIKIPNFIRSGLVCCHVVGYYFKNLGATEIANLDPESFDTEELYQMIKNSPNFKEVYRKDK